MPTLEQPHGSSRPEPVSGPLLADAFRDYFGAITVDQASTPDESILATVHASAAAIHGSFGSFSSGVLKAADAYERFHFVRYGKHGMSLPPFETAALRREYGDSILRIPTQACAFAALSGDRSYLTAAAEWFFMEPNYVKDTILAARSILINQRPKGEVIRGLDRAGVKKVADQALASAGIRKPNSWLAFLGAMGGY